MAIERYKVVVCPKCGRPAITTAEKSYRCRFCGRTSGMARMYRDGYIHIITRDYDEAIKKYMKVVERFIGL